MESSQNLPKIKFISQPENFSSKMVGEIYQQMMPFEWHTYDQGNYGDAYEEKVAKFQKISDVNMHSPNYFTLSEWEFRELKDVGCIAYVKEQSVSHKAKPSLEDKMADATLKAGTAIGWSEKTGPNNLGGR